MRRPVATLAIVASISVLAFITPSAVTASSEVPTSAVQTYELRPEAGLLHVTIDMIVRNRIPSSTTYEPCTQLEWDPWYGGYYPVASTCPRTTDYYINDTSIFIEDGARNIHLSTDAGAATKNRVEEQYGFTKYKVTFKKIFNGSSRRIRATYDLPSAAPRSGGSIRAGRAYASFCVSGNGQDSGTIRVIAPSAFTLQHVESGGLGFATSRAGGKTTFATGAIANPIQAWACFSGTNPSGYAKTTVAGPGGRAVQIESWPEDAAWRASVTADVRSSLPRLAELAGRSVPGSGPLIVREVASGSLGEYAGDFDVTTAVAEVGEDFAQPGLVAHELSHAWFNGKLFKSTWLSEGYADWAASLNGGDTCDRLPAFPAAGKPDIEQWKYLGPKATEDEKAVARYDYEASCWLIGSLAQRIGTDRMTSVLQALFDGTDPYGAQTVMPATGPVAWQRWLDAVDELGMVPAREGDLDVVQSRLAQVGVATDSTILRERSAARSAYHQLAAAAGDWVVPEAVRAPLSQWSFNSASSAAATAAAVLASVDEVAVALPETDPFVGPVRARWESARSQSDLGSVAAFAADQAHAAHAVVDARSAERETSDPISQIGLLGTDLKPLFATAIEQVGRGDAQAALASVASIDAALKGAPSAGWIRIVIVASLALALLLAAVVGRRRRRRGSVRHEVRSALETLPADPFNPVVIDAEAGKALDAGGLPRHAA